MKQTRSRQCGQCPPVKITTGGLPRTDRCIEANTACHTSVDNAHRVRDTPDSQKGDALAPITRANIDNSHEFITATWTMPRGYAKHETPKGSMHSARLRKGDTPSSQGEKHRKIKHSNVVSYHAHLDSAQRLREAWMGLPRGDANNGILPSKEICQIKAKHANVDKYPEATQRTTLSRKVRDGQVKHANAGRCPQTGYHRNLDNAPQGRL